MNMEIKDFKILNMHRQKLCIMYVIIIGYEVIQSKM